jgi:hypothetical protein
MRPFQPVTRTAVLVSALLAVSGCASDVDEPRYGADQLRLGVAIAVDDDAQAVDTAVVLLPDELPAYLSYHPVLDEQGIAVMQPGQGGYDAVVMYRTGPFCGLLPDVAVTGDENLLDVEITTNGHDGPCDAMEYDEAIGLTLLPGFENATISAHHRR